MIKRLRKLKGDVNYAFRSLLGKKLYNYLHGRKKVKEEMNLDLDRIKGILESFTEDGRRYHQGEYQLTHPFRGFPREEVTTQRAYNFVNAHFRESMFPFLQFRPPTGNYQVYSGSRTEKHYIEVLAERRVKPKKEERQSQKLTIEFLVDK